MRSKNSEREKELIDDKKNLTEWLTKIKEEKVSLEKSLDYLRAKEAPLLSHPQVSMQPGRSSTS